MVSGSHSLQPLPVVDLLPSSLLASSFGLCVTETSEVLGKEVQHQGDKEITFGETKLSSRAVKRLREESPLD